MKTHILAKTTAVIVGSTILTTLAVNAVDMRGHVVTSFLASLFNAVMQEDAAVCPDNMVLVESALVPFCVDVYEASTDEHCTFRDPQSEEQSALNLADPRCGAANEPLTHPWRFITRDQAAQACAVAGKRLATPGEWYVAARGTPDDTAALTDEHCNIAYNRADGADVTGGGMRCVSDVGTYDMVGNVWEWVEGDVVQGVYASATVPVSGYVQAVDTTGMPIETGESINNEHGADRFWSDRTTDNAIMRGGYFDSRSSAGTFAVYAASPPSFSGAATGFRCVKEIQQQ